jgi:hypothetical protein
MDWVAGRRRVQEPVVCLLLSLRTEELRARIFPTFSGVWLWNVTIHLPGGLPMGSAKDLNTAKAESRPTGSGSAPPHAYQAGCHQRRRRGGSGTRGAGGGKANRSAFCRKRSHSSRVSVSCARNSSETARKVAICASRTGVRSGVAFGTTVSPVTGWGDRIDPVQFGGVNLVCVGSGARQLATFRRLNSPSVNLVIGSTPDRTGRVVCHRYGYRPGLTDG